MKVWQRRTVGTILLLASAIVATYHAGTARPRVDSKAEARGTFERRRDGNSIHQLILEGAPRARGRIAASYTVELLAAQEAALQKQLSYLVPSALMRGALELALMRWFSGIDSYFEPRELDEMAGVGEHAPREFDSLADGFTRQVAYHGIHEVGQMFVDVGADMGCTVFAVPGKTGWSVARNFDFEGGRIFDEEKILKWVFPDDGFAFVSVIWAGMVGAVTGVNEHGVYISINAAGSADFRRQGTPTTLIALRVLERARSAEQATQILREATSFITDIFLVADRTSAFRVEKSPARTFVHPLTEATVIANHLSDPAWNGDRVNELRKTKLTTLAREARGKELLASLRKDVPTEQQLLTFLRDKGRRGNLRLPLGHRSAIDALIATHSVVYSAATDHLWVGAGPSVAGPFLGYDLKASFRAHKPVPIAVLPADPEVSVERYHKSKKMAADVAAASRAIHKGECGIAAPMLEPHHEDPEASYGYWMALGDLRRCKGESEAARAAWKKTAELHPAYSWENDAVEERLR